MSISIKNKHFQIEGKNYFIYSGEMHYFRIREDLWDVHLDKAAEAGLNTVSTYVPWCIHEPEEHQFDLKSFISFAQKVKQKGLFLIARVGPVSNAELRFEGIPAWLTHSYPQVYLKGKELGNLPHDTLLAYNHPDFLELVSRWYGKILPVVRENLIDNGGAISMVQLCNEIGMVHWLNKAADYNLYSEQKYRDFLENKFGAIENLNTEYMTSYNSFDEVFQPKNMHIECYDNLTPYFDWMDYYCSYYADYFSFLHKKALEHGINVPFIANAPQFYDYDVRGRGIFSPMTTLMFRDFSKKVADVVIGGAYQMRRLDYENFHDVFLTSEVVKMIMSPDVPAMCCELQFGILRDIPRLYPSDIELNLKASAASGLDALNGYMFSGGKNYDGTGAMGEYHEWQAPVTSGGSERPHYAAVKQFGKVISNAGNLLACTEKKNDTVFGFYSPYYSTELLNGPFVWDMEPKRTHQFFDGFARSAILAGYSFSFKDLVRSTAEELSQLPDMFCLSFDIMDEDTQNKLADYVLAGGRLFMYPRIPVKNLKNQECRILAERTGISAGDTTKDKFIYMNGLESMVTPPVQLYKNKPGVKELAKTASGELCAVKVSAGKGTLVAAGFGSPHIYDYHVKLAEMLLEEAGIIRQLKISPGSEVIVNLRASEDYGFLFASNYHEMPGKLWIETPIPGSDDIIRIPRAGEFSVAPRSAYVMPLNLPVSADLRILYITGEIENTYIDEKLCRLSVRGSGNCEAVLVCGRTPSAVKIDGDKIKYKDEDGRIYVEFFVKATIAELEIVF